MGSLLEKCYASVPHTYHRATFSYVEYLCDCEADRVQLMSIGRKVFFFKESWKHAAHKSFSLRYFTFSLRSVCLTIARLMPKSLFRVHFAQRFRVVCVRPFAFVYILRRDLRVAYLNKIVKVACAIRRHQQKSTALRTVMNYSLRSYWPSLISKAILNRCINYYTLKVIALPSL